MRNPSILGRHVRFNVHMTRLVHKAQAVGDPFDVLLDGQKLYVSNWGGRRPKDLYMNELPVKWAAEHPNFKYVPVISDALPEDDWSGRGGFVHRAVMQDFPDLSGHQVYACGVPVMVDAAKKDFTTICRLPEEEFYCDSFTTAADKPT